MKKFRLLAAMCVLVLALGAMTACGGNNTQSTGASPETTVDTTAPETTAPETTAPETTAPETTVDTTAPETAAETTAE